MSRASFSRAEDDLLVARLQAYPSLYDPQHKDYKNVEIRESIWRGISEELGRSGKTIIEHRCFQILLDYSSFLRLENRFRLLIIACVVGNSHFTQPNQTTLLRVHL